MEFSQDPGTATNRIQAYYDDYIIVSGQKYYDRFLIMPETLISPWGPPTFQELTENHFLELLAFKPQLVIIGCGKVLKFLSSDLMESLRSEGIGVEVMTTPAACRTYTLLQAEGRNVLALLFFN